MPKQKYSKKEITRRAKELYEGKIRPKVEEANFGKYLILDIETEEYEIDTLGVIAAGRLRAKNPDAILYGFRIGYPALAKVGGGWGTVVHR